MKKRVSFSLPPIVCVTMKKSAKGMASTTSDTGDTSSKQQQAQCKENYSKSKRPVLSIDHCHPYRRKKRREAVVCVCVCVCVRVRACVRACVRVLTGSAGCVLCWFCTCTNGKSIIL